MKLHILPGSPNCRKVEAVISHLNLDVEMIPHQLASGDLKKPEFLALNPNGKVPLLEDQEFTLWESNAIMIYLTTRSKDSSLFPESDRADILRWLFWEVSHLNLASGKVAWEVLAKPMFGMGDPIQSIVDEGVQSFHQFAPTLEDRLSDGRAFITGSELSLADFAVGRHAPFFQVGNEVMDPLLKNYPKITAWYKRLNEVPAWTKTQPPWLRKG